MHNTVSTASGRIWHSQHYEMISTLTGFTFGKASPNAHMTFTQAFQNQKYQTKVYKGRICSKISTLGNDCQCYHTAYCTPQPTSFCRAGHSDYFIRASASRISSPLMPPVPLSSMSCLRVRASLLLYSLHSESRLALEGLMFTVPATEHVNRQDKLMYRAR